MTLYDDLSFIIRNKNRKSIFQALTKPKTPTQLSKELNINVGFVSNLIIDLSKRKLIVCLSPNEKRHRFYKITTKGQKILKEIRNL